MANRTPGEPAVIQALQSVAKYPESKDFVETMSRSLPGLQTLLDAPLQPEGCMSTRTSQSPVPSTTTQRALLSFSMLSPVSGEEPGRKRVSPHELSQRRAQVIAQPVVLPLTNESICHDQ